MSSSFSRFLEYSKDPRLTELGWSPADPFVKDIQGRKNAFESQGTGDDFDLFVTDRAQLPGTLRPEMCELLWRVPAKFFAAESEEMLATETSVGWTLVLRPQRSERSERKT